MDNQGDDPNTRRLRSECPTHGMQHGDFTKAPGEGSIDSPFRVEYLDAERLLPILVRRAA